MVCGNLSADFGEEDENLRVVEETVPSSSSSSSLRPAAGPQEVQHQNSQQEPTADVEHLPSDSASTSSDAKHQMEIDTAKGASVRVAFKAMKRVRIEARRKKEREERVAPEVLLDSFLIQVNLELHPLSEC